MLKLSKSLSMLKVLRFSRKLLKWKNWMKENFGVVAALSSPGHVTMIPPFWMKDELESVLINALDKFANSCNEFLIRLRNFSHFKSRTIYLKAETTSTLADFREDLFQFLKYRRSFPVPKKEGEFTPHLTIATRDLDRKTFRQAWEHFKALDYHADWNCRSVSLLRHNKKNWDVVATSQFNKFSG